MTAITNYASDINKVRLLIGDIDDTEQVFSNAAIQAFIDMALDGNVKRAAAAALLVMAVNEVMVQKRIRLLDLSTDGPAEAAALKSLAMQLRDEADIEEVTGAFDWAEQIQTPAQYQEWLYKDALRS